VHHNTDIWRFSTPVPGDPQWANWPSGLLWLSAHLGDHLDYGADDAFALETARETLLRYVTLAERRAGGHPHHCHAAELQPLHGMHGRQANPPRRSPTAGP
jgi:hypothetical protein